MIARLTPASPRFASIQPSLTIAPATTANKAQLISLFNQYRQGAGQPSDLAVVDKYISQRLTLGDSVSLLATMGQRPAGFVQLFKRYGALSMKPTWYIQDLFVKPEMRRQGVAAALLNESKAFAKLDGTDRLDLKTGVNNQPARTLYEGQGFHPTELSDQFAYYRWNA